MGELTSSTKMVVNINKQHHARRLPVTMIGVCASFILIAGLSSSRQDVTQWTEGQKSRISRTPVAVLHTYPPVDVNENIASVFARAAGVYQSEELRTIHGTENTVLLTSANAGMQPFLENWMCHANRLGYKYLVQSFDESIHGNLVARNIPSVIVTMSSAEFSSYGSEAYNNIVKQKLHIQRLALQLGYDFFFSDIDVGLAKDAFHLFKRDCNIEAQTEKMAADGSGIWGINTGFFYAKCNNSTLGYFNHLAKLEGNTHDQALFNSMIKNDKITLLQHTDPKRSESDFRKLDPMRIVVGNAVTQEHRSFSKLIENSRNMTYGDIHMIHANYVSGKQPKFKILRETGLWVCAGESPELCEFCDEFSSATVASKIESYLHRDDVH